MTSRRTKTLASASTLTISLLGMGAAGIGAAGAGTVAAVGTVGVAAATAAQVSPMIRVVAGHFKAAPTTAQCEEDFSLACYSPQQYQAAYDMGPLYKRGLTGTGKTIVLVDSFGSPTIKSDLAAFDAGFNLPAPPSFKILIPDGPVPAFDPTNSDMVGWAEETSLDVEYAHAMAPGANIDLVETPVSETEGLVGIPQIVAAENSVIKRHIGDVISQSFGATEETFPSKQSILNQRSAFINAAAHNVTVLGASGDGGATDSQTDITDYYTHRVDSWPSTDPLVTSVGGTQLHLNSTGARTEPDNVWNDTNIFGSPAAGGGGLSTVFGRPAFQNGVKSIVGSHRGTPDVSMTAAVDGAALVFISKTVLGTSAFYLIGGTSEATPVFSGIVAIADQAAGHDLGDLNPSLYALAAAKAPGLVDVTLGNNTVTFEQGGKTVTVPGFDAVPGYDLASGLGTVDGNKLVKELSASSAVS